MVSRKAEDKEVFLAPKALSPSFSYMIAFPAHKSTYNPNVLLLLVLSAAHWDKAMYVMAIS